MGPEEIAKLMSEAGEEKLIYGKDDFTNTVRNLHGLAGLLMRQIEAYNKGVYDAAYFHKQASTTVSKLVESFKLLE